LTDLQAEIIHRLHVKPVIDPQEEIKKRVQFLKEYLRKTGANGFVLGISGGQDSTLAGKLAQMAVEELREEGTEAKFVAVRLPYGIQQDEEDAIKAIHFIKPDEEYVFNIKESVDAVKREYEKVSGGKILKDYHKGNVKARMRMIVQYVFGGQENLLVIGTVEVLCPQISKAIVCVVVQQQGAQNGLFGILVVDHATASRFACSAWACRP